MNLLHHSVKEQKRSVNFSQSNGNYIQTQITVI